MYIDHELTSNDGDLLASPHSDDGGSDTDEDGAVLFFDYSWRPLMLCSDLAFEPVLVGVAEKVYEWRVAVQ